MPSNPRDGIDVDADGDGQITRADIDAASASIGQKLDIGVVTGVIATFISLLALFVGWREAYLAQQSLRADTLPIIDVSLGYNVPDGDERIRFATTLTNVGTGTAHIVTVTPTIDGQAPASRKAWLDQFSYPGYRGFSRLLSEDGTGYLLAGDSLTPLAVTWGNSQSTRAERDKFLRDNPDAIAKMDVEVCYCSVFDTCFIARASDRTAPDTVRSCNPGNMEMDGFAVLPPQAPDE